MDTKFKETEIGLIPENWEIRELKSLGKVLTGKTPSTKNKNNFGLDYPFITPRDMKGQKYIFNTERYLSEEGKNKVKNCILPPNSICVSCIGSDMGKVVMNVKKSVTNQQLNSIIPKGINPHFMYYSLQNIQDWLRDLAFHSTAVPILNKKDFSMIKIAVPNNSSEVNGIVTVLSDLDSKIELNQRMNQTLEEIGRAIFKHWFVDFEFPDEQGRPYKSSGGEMVDSELGEIPKGWEVAENISELCELTNYGYTQSSTEEKIGPKFLRVMDINKGDWINWKKVPYCEIEKKRLSKYILEKGDIVVARMADPGKVAIFESDLSAVFASYLIRIRLKNRKLSYYLYYLMKSKYYQYYILGAASGTVQRNLNAKGLTTGLSVPIPHENVINKFNKTVRLLRTRINQNIEEIENLSKIRDSLLPKLMSGKIRVKGDE